MLMTSRATQTSTAAYSNSAEPDGRLKTRGGAAPAPAPPAPSGGNNLETTKVVMREKKARCGSFTWKRLSGLGNVTDGNFKSEMNKRLEAKSRANIIGWEVVTAKSAQKMKTRYKEDFTGSPLPIPGLDKSRKSEIYRKNLPLGLPKTIKSLDYESDQHTGPIVATRDETLKIFASPIKKTGLLETRDGSLRKSYKIIKDGLPARRREFDPRSLAAPDPDYLRKSLGLEKSFECLSSLSLPLIKFQSSQKIWTRL